MSDPTEEDVLDRGEVIDQIAILSAGAAPTDAAKGGIINHLLAHDAAQRARIEALEAERQELREALEGCEKNLRLFHDAAVLHDPAELNTEKPPSTFEAWNNARRALEETDE